LNNTLFVNGSFSSSKDNCSVFVSVGDLDIIDGQQIYSGNISLGQALNFTLNLTDLSNEYGKNYTILANVTCDSFNSVVSLENISVTHYWLITNQLSIQQMADLVMTLGIIFDI
jgi:hypothetical protein